MSKLFCKLFFALCLTWFIFFVLEINSTKAVAGDTFSGGKQVITSSDVFGAVQKVNYNLDLVRQYMGAPKPIEFDIRVNEAAPQDVYFQALTLFEKSNRLSFEVARIQDFPPLVPEESIQPFHVFGLVEKANKAIKIVMDDLNISKADFMPQPDLSKTPSDVFKKIMLINRQLNLLLERRFSPSDVYMRVNLAIGYAARLLSQHSGFTRIPSVAVFETKKNPADVYTRLLACLKIISSIYKSAGLKMLDIDTRYIDKKNITPSDVFDVASLIVARLDFLHKKFGVKKKPRPVFYPGRKYPSDVYHHARILEIQLKQINGFILNK
ncbi:MAG: hypothetical protein L3J69_17180 [Desulfobacula sp.]|nr:hypothetical protein [Desulfobacula sp.]